MYKLQQYLFYSAKRIERFHTMLFNNNKFYVKLELIANKIKIKTPLIIGKAGQSFVNETEVFEN